MEENENEKKSTKRTEPYVRISYVNPQASEKGETVSDLIINELEWDTYTGATYSQLPSFIKGGKKRKPDAKKRAKAEKLLAEIGAE